MTKIRKTPRRLPPESERRMRSGSATGAETVSRGFASALTRRRFCELVGIHKTTLRRWEAAGIVKPRMEPVMGIPTAVFDESEVELGYEVARLIHEQPGQLSLHQAAAEARRILGLS